MGDDQPSSGDLTNVPPNPGQPSSARLSSPGMSDLKNFPPNNYGYQSLPAGGVPHGAQSPFHFQVPPAQQPSPSQPRLSQQNIMQLDQNSASRFSSSISMASLATALPDAGYTLSSYGQQPSQRYSSAMPGPTLLYQMQQSPPYPGQTVSPSSTFNVQHQGIYSGQQSPQALQMATNVGQHYYPNQSFLGPPQVQQIAPYFYSQGQYSPQGQPYPSGSYHSQYGVRGNMASDGASAPQRSNVHMAPNMGQGSAIQPTSDGSGSASAQSPVPRGPPRKPKQSGHALWVGNLPPGAKVIDLKDHFSRDATNDILSVFLISKSNCAFVNYRTEASCAAAMSRFHDSRFQGVRLVCRLRRTSVNAVSGVPTGPAALSPQKSLPIKNQSVDGEKDSSEDANTTEQGNPDTPTTKDKYFIVKSLTVEDLEMSVRNGIWATQSHNEEALNEAYEAADNVYLIFSANKSGEYFGYGRMTSPINEDPAAAIEFAPKAQLVEDPDLPKAIQTEASEFAPKGRIIDDSARGTIFWEAEFNNENTPVDTADNRSDQSDAEGEAESSTKAWGKPFTIQWISTNRLPFYRTRGLRNPWNSNREVKIARDGTELETSVGRRLVAMFHRDPSPVGLNVPMTMPIIGGYPQTRPY